MNYPVNYASTREKLKEICDLGLIAGEGNRDEPGQLCIESAIALALGESHSDKPSCVHEVDRAFAVGLNDANWPDPITRGRALYALGCAQLGTAGTDRTEWAHRLTEGTIRRVLPIALRAAADVHPKPEHQVALRDAADRCEAEGTREAANAASDAVRYASHYAASNAASFYAEASLAAAAAAYTASEFTHAVFVVDAVSEAAEAAAEAAAYAASYACAASYDTYAAVLTTADRLHVLTTAVEVALDAYRAEGRT